MSTSNKYLVSLKYHHDNVVQSSDYVDEGLDCWQRKRDLQEVRINNCHNLFLFRAQSAVFIPARSRAQSSPASWKINQLPVSRNFSIWPEEWQTGHRLQKQHLVFAQLSQLCIVIRGNWPGNMRWFCTTDSRNSGDCGGGPSDSYHCWKYKWLMLSHPMFRNNAVN